MPRSISPENQRSVSQPHDFLSIGLPTVATVIIESFKYGRRRILSEASVIVFFDSKLAEAKADNSPLV